MNRRSSYNINVSEYKCLIKIKLNKNWSTRLDTISALITTPNSPKSLHMIDNYCCMNADNHLCWWHSHNTADINKCYHNKPVDELARALVSFKRNLNVFAMTISEGKLFQMLVIVLQKE